MRMRALYRLIAKIGIAALLFTQVAVAAYACFAPPAPGQGMADIMPGCDLPDTASPNLCLQHCQAGSQSVQTAPQVPIPAIAVAFLASFAPIQPASGPGITALSALAQRETFPPPQVLFGVLRI